MMIFSFYFSQAFIFHQTCRHHHGLLSVFSGRNKESGDTAVSLVWISHPERGRRLETFPRSAQETRRAQRAARRTSQPLKACPSNKGGSRSLAHITHERAPADTLLTRGHRCQNEGHNPWELLTPLCLDELPLFGCSAPVSSHKIGSHRGYHSFGV